MAASGAPRTVRLGRVAGLYGVRGWVRVRSDTEPQEGILDYSPWLVRVGDGWQPVTLAEGRPHGAGLVVRFEGIDDPDQARSFIGADIGATREQLPALPADEHYWIDLEGLEVRNLDGTRLGTVERVMETGANDVLVVRGERERLIPYVAAVVREVDLEQGTLRVDWEPDY